MKLEAGQAALPEPVPLAPLQRRAAFEIAFALLALGASLPLLVTERLPIQDYPQHLAAVRVLHDYHSPSLGFERFFELTPLGTQYLSVYYAAHLLAYVVGVPLALKLVLGAALTGFPYALGLLLSELKRPREYALLCLPLLYNAHFALGFLNFVAGLPLLFWGLGSSLRAERTSSWRARAGVGVLACACFLTHLVPYGLLLLGVSLLHVRRPLTRSLLALSPLAPSLLLFAWWSQRTPAGQLLSRANAWLELPQPSFERAFDELPIWLTDITRGPWDQRLLGGWLLLIVAVWLAGRSPSARWEPALRRFAWSCPACVAAYWLLPESLGFIWPINGRFPIIALLCVIPLLPPLAGPSLIALRAAGAALACGAILNTSVAFYDSGQREFAGLSAVLERIPEGSRVVGLVFERASRYLNFSPFLHAAAWSQAERGGVAMFSFAEFPMSVYRFRETTRPPHVPPRWEWLPERVDSRRDLVYYDYALTRGGPRRLPGFRRIVTEARWSLWQREP